MTVDENKEMQNGMSEAELEEKILQDVSEKIAEAAAELEEEIAEAGDAAEEIAEETVEEYFGEDADAFDGETDLMAEDGVEGFDEAEEEPIPEPKWITIKLRNLVLSLVGTAVAGALLLFLGLQIPAWIESIPEGKTVATVDGTAITDKDMEYYIYAEAMEYFQENRGTLSLPTEYDWSKEVEEGKTAEDIVKERALETAISEAVTMNMGEKAGMEWDEKEATASAAMQISQMESVYGEELVELNSKAQGLGSTKQYRRKVVQAQHLSAVEEDMETNPDNYFPEDKAALKDYPGTEGASVKHVLISTEAKEGEEPVNVEEKRALAEEILARAKAGEDFDALVAEYNEDPGQTEKGYTFGPGEMQEAFEEAAFALGIDEISGIVETNYGYHIIKRIPGKYELSGYWKAQSKIKVKERAIKKISVKELLEQIEADTEAFQAMYQEQQGGAQ